jgi:nucleotide-binding universal stress UspA family protein
MLAIGTILHPTDFSDASGAAFRLACSLARDHDARLVVLHVGREPVIAPVEGAVPTDPEQYHQELTTALHHIRAEAPKVRLEHWLTFAADPAGEIVQVARQVEADLIVMGTHGRTGLRRLVMGSVAEQVVRRAPCPVVTLKTPVPEMRLDEEASPETAGEVAGAAKG